MTIEISGNLSNLLAGSMIIFMKLCVIIVAYKIVKLGHDLILKGAKGEFSFMAGFKGFSADLQSVSPGLLFVLLGCAVLVIAVTTKFPQESTETTTQSSNEQAASFQLPGVEAGDRDISAFITAEQTDED